VLKAHPEHLAPDALEDRDQIAVGTDVALSAKIT
jgi:hypothetical protein